MGDEAEASAEKEFASVINRLLWKFAGIVSLFRSLHYVSGELQTHPGCDIPFRLVKGEGRFHLSPLSLESGLTESAGSPDGKKSACCTGH